MIDHDDVRFSSFTRDLARRHRRPRSYPPAPVRADALEQLCGGSIVPASMLPLPQWPDDASSPDLESEAS
ncbi:MAG: hypothetical protein KF850_27930 [Labilithrix sp.]|nr:hypothetical protein [Labilithrix sp.]